MSHLNLVHHSLIYGPQTVSAADLNGPIPSADSWLEDPSAGPWIEPGG